jgi:hypothetical protein
MVLFFLLDVKNLVKKYIYRQNYKYTLIKFPLLFFLKKRIY